MKIIKNRDYNFLKLILDLTTYEKIVRLLNVFSQDNSSFYFEQNKKYSLLKRTSENTKGFRNKFSKFNKSLEFLEKIKYSHMTKDYYCFKDENKEIKRINKNNLLYVIYK